MTFYSVTESVSDERNYISDNSGLSSSYSQRDKGKNEFNCIKKKNFNHFKNNIVVLVAADGINATYGIEMELLEGGLLKRSSFDVELETDVEVTNLLSVSPFNDCNKVTKYY